MFDKIKKIIQEDLQRRYEQLEERFMVFEQNLYGRLSDRLENLENQLDQISEILRQNISRNNVEASDEHSTSNIKKESSFNKNTSIESKVNKQDELQKLAGLGSIMEKKLNAEGIVSFEQLATLSEADLESLNLKIPGLKIRYERYEWRKEAGKLV